MQDTNLTVRKVIRDGRVAVLWSPGYGAGWFTWNRDYPQCLFEPRIVDAVETGLDKGTISALATEMYGEGFYPGGAGDLKIEWLPEGTRFQVDEYDGSESIRTIDDPWLIA